MPIHDQGYQRYAGARSAIGKSWQVMTRAGVMSVITKRQFMGLMLFAWAPFVVRAVQIYVSATFTQASFLAPKYSPSLGDRLTISRSPHSRVYQR